MRAAAARRGAGGGHRPVRRRRWPPPTGWRCCSSASTSCRCATTTCAATRARRSARSCADRPAQGRADLGRRLRRLGGARCPTTPRGAREREFAELYARPRRAAGARPGALDVGDLVLQRVPAAAREAARARAARGALPPRARRRAAGHELRPGPAAAAARRRARRDHRVRRRRPGDPPLPRRGDQEHPRLPGRVAAGDGRAAGASRCARRAACSPPRGAVVAPIEDRLEKALEPADGATAARSRSGAARPSARRRRPSPPTSSGWSPARTSRPEDVVRARALGARARARPSRSRSRSAPCPYHLSGAAAFFQRAEVRDLLAWLRLLVDPGDAGAVVRALARPPVELRAIDLARVTQIARRRKLDMVAALSRRAGVAADPARGARADRQLPQALPRRRGRARLRRGPTSTCTG